MSRAPDDDRPVTRSELRAVLLTLASALGAPATGYSSRRGHGPPGYEHRAWQDLARRIGAKRGRWWHVTAEALATYEASEQAPFAPTSEPATSSATLARRLGLRLVGGR